MSSVIRPWGLPPTEANRRPADRTNSGLHRKTLDAAWRNVLLDLKTRIQRGDLVLSAVQISPKLLEQPEIIPGQWAMALRINPLESTVWLRQTRYVNALLTPAADAEAVATPPAAAKSVTPDNVRDLDADTIIALLEEYSPPHDRGRHRAVADAAASQP